MYTFYILIKLSKRMERKMENFEISRVDHLSLWMIKKLFWNMGYALEGKNQLPVAYDCQARKWVFDLSNCERNQQFLGINQRRN